MKTKIIKKVSDLEFYAAHDAYLESINTDNSSDIDEADALARARAYWGLGDMPTYDFETVKPKTKLINKIKSLFLN